MLRALLLIVFILLLVGAIPVWPYSLEWGYVPFSTLGVVLIIVLILSITGEI